MIGQVVGVHIDERFIRNGLLDTAAMKPIARGGYHDYSVLTESFTMRRPTSVAETRAPVLADSKARLTWNFGSTAALTVRLPHRRRAFTISARCVARRAARGEHRGARKDVVACFIFCGVADRTATRLWTRSARDGRTAPQRPSIGLVLGGGAARGFAHIGVIRTLLAKGFTPDIITGTSIGAVVGGCYAAGKLDEVEAWGRGLTRRSLLSYLDVSFSGSGLLSGGKLADKLTEAIGDVTIDKLPVRYAAIATEIGTGHEIWITRGTPDRRAARLLCAARDLSAGAARRALAGRRRAGQSGAGVGRARARRARW